MTKRRSGMTITGTCRFPGCDQPRQPTTPHGHAAYCDNPAHNKDTAYRARQRAAVAAQGQELQRLRELLRNAGLATDPAGAGGAEQVA
jgi:hypothetical protein